MPHTGTRAQAGVPSRSCRTVRPGRWPPPRGGETPQHGAFPHVQFSRRCGGRRAVGRCAVTCVHSGLSSGGLPIRSLSTVGRVPEPSHPRAVSGGVGAVRGHRPSDNTLGNSHHGLRAGPGAGAPHRVPSHGLQEPPCLPAQHRSEVARDLGGVSGSGCVLSSSLGGFNDSAGIRTAAPLGQSPLRGGHWEARPGLGHELRGPRYIYTLGHGTEIRSPPAPHCCSAPGAQASFWVRRRRVRCRRGLPLPGVRRGRQGVTPGATVQEEKSLSTSRVTSLPGLTLGSTGGHGEDEEMTRVITYVRTGWSAGIGGPQARSRGQSWPACLPSDLRGRRGGVPCGLDFKEQGSTSKAEKSS